MTRLSKSLGRIIVVAAASLLLTQPGNEVYAAAPPVANAPTPDLRTPESALRSFWAIKEWEHAVLRKEQERLALRGAEAAIPLYISVSTGAVKSYFENFAPYPRETLERTIKDIAFESDARAVAIVNIKNTTPVSKGAKPAPREVTERTRGRDFRYVLLKQGPDWKVSEVWGLSMPGSFLGERMIYEAPPPLYPSAVVYD